MAAKLTHIVKAVIYDPRKDKPSYIQVGRATTDDQGRIAVFIETLPRDMANWRGWLNLFPYDETARPKSAHNPAFDDDIPF